MYVKDVLKTATLFLDRTDLYSVLVGNAEATEEQQYELDVLLCCYNAVEDELARTSFPLVKAEHHTVTDGKVEYGNFGNSPVRILSVKYKGRKVPCTLYTKYLNVDVPEVDITFAYAPTVKELSDTCEVSGEAQSVELPALGVAAEYCLISGLDSEAEMWEK
jgi:hypothetical protein